MASVLLHTEPPRQSTSEISSEERVIRDLCHRWASAVCGRDPASVRDLLAERCVLLPPNGDSVKGRDAVTRAWERIFSLPGFRIAFEPDRINLYPTGDIAHDIGRYRLTFHPTGNGNGRGRHDHGSHLIVWERGDGEWRVRSNVFYSRGLEGVRLLEAPRLTRAAPPRAGLTPARPRGTTRTA